MRKLPFEWIDLTHELALGQPSLIGVNLRNKMLKFTLDCFASLAKTIHKNGIVIASGHCCVAVYQEFRLKTAA